MSGSHRRPRRGGVNPDMNVTPLVDVVLVLLIIFMVVAPQLQQDVPLDLPGIFNPDPQVEGNMDPISVSVARRGEYHVEDRQYDLDGVIQYLATQRSYNPSRRLVLRADAKLKYADVRDFMARAQQIGFPGLNFQVGEKHREDGAATARQASAPAQPGSEPAAAAPPASLGG